MAENSTPSDAPNTPREIRSLSPEARRLRAQTQQGLLDFIDDLPLEEGAVPRSRRWLYTHVGPGSRPFTVVERTLVGAYNDGFIHAGNLAYLTMLAIFPFFILSGFLFQMVGGAEQKQMIVETVLSGTPPTVREAIAPVALTAINARSGWLLWFGAAVALWMVSSLIETIRDILRRAYGTSARHAFWKYRLFSALYIIGAVVLLMLALFAQFVIGGLTQMLDASLPQLAGVIQTLQLSRIVPAIVLFGSLYLLFFTLTPQEYRKRRYPKWPGALLTTIWWIAVTMAMPRVLRAFVTYDLTYGSLAGIIVALFFFWLVGLGLVIGAELNAALAEPEADGDANAPQ